MSLKPLYDRVVVRRLAAETTRTYLIVVDGLHSSQNRLNQGVTRSA